jgi:hypothetical protein
VTRALQTGKFMGAPATRKNVEIRGIFMRRVAGGKVVEEFRPGYVAGIVGSSPPRSSRNGGYSSVISIVYAHTR